MIFQFSIGGHFGTGFEIELVEERLLVCCETKEDLSGIEHVSIPIIANAKWKEVVDFLSTRKWKSSYYQEGVVDGTQWELQVLGNELNITCCGSNAYPPGFRKFLKLLNQLTEPEGIHIY